MIARTIATGLLLALPAAAEAASPIVEAKLRDVRLVIAQNCQLQGWQFALEPDAESHTRVELSPTLPQTQVVCVYQALSDYDITLDRPAPVEVTRRKLADPQKVY